MSLFALSRIQEEALLILLEDIELVRCKSKWSGKSVQPVTMHTILALFDRHLVRIRCQTGRASHPARLSAVLDALGLRVARDLKRERQVRSSTASNMVAMPAQGAA